jgi:hypothetical protein
MGGYRKKEGRKRRADIRTVEREGIQTTGRHVIV